MQNHGIGDISHMKFIKANELELKCHALCKRIKRIDRALKVRQFAVHFTHEFMKMQTRFTLERHRVVKQIHQKAFAAPHAAKQIHPLRNVGVV